MIDIEKMIGIREAALIIGLTPQRLSQLIKTGELKPIRIDNKFLFDRDEIVAYANKRNEKGRT